MTMPEENTSVDNTKSAIVRAFTVIEFIYLTPKFKNLYANGFLKGIYKISLVN
jgi:hypothetical protein